MNTTDSPPSTATPLRPSPLRVYRQAFGYSQEEAAARAGITREALGALERGQAEPKMGTASALAQIFNTSVARLFPPNDERRSPKSAAVQEPVEQDRHGEP